MLANFGIGTLAFGKPKDRLLEAISATRREIASLRIQVGLARLGHQ
ncbi:MAG: hypothetical protein QOK01_1554 [Alphaproteobacteria bacterium]|jgi:hypothetical protein|nr:hypothetical protein [Alphaproteobacteria bacterium]